MTRPFLVSGMVMLACITVSHAQNSHVANAKREYAAIFSHPESPCTGPQYSTVDYEACMSKELNFLEPHMQAFLSDLQGVEASTGATLSGGQPGGVALLEKTTASWKLYRDNLCHLAYSEYEGGTGAAPAEQQCIFEQDRAYVKTIANWIQLQILAD